MDACIIAVVTAAILGAVALYYLSVFIGGVIEGAREEWRKRHWM
jgi:hypothetical protein